YDHRGALRHCRVELLLLQRDIGGGVLVDQRAIRTELLHFGAKARPVMLLVAGRALVGHQERHCRPLGLRKGWCCQQAGAEARRQRRSDQNSGHALLSLDNCVVLIAPARSERDLLVGCRLPARARRVDCRWLASRVRRGRLLSTEATPWTRAAQVPPAACDG